MNNKLGEETRYNLVPTANWFTKLISLQADIIYNCITTIFSPLTFFFSLASESYHRAEDATTTLESAVLKVPSKLTHFSTSLLRRIGMGILGAIHVSIVLTAVMLLAVLLGVGLVQLLVEEPVFMREKLLFDYTDANPQAVISFVGVGVKSRQTPIPVGHTIHFSLILLVPESDYNWQVGIFQVNAELLSSNKRVIAKSSQPCMLRFRSLPIRLLRTFAMGIPLVLGLAEETQKITIDLLKHKEYGGISRTKSIRVYLIPRAGTSYVPQVYEAEIQIKSELPWNKQLLRNWKWTLCVWASLYIYIILLIILLSCCKILIFPTAAAGSFVQGTYEDEQGEVGVEEISHDDQRDIHEMLRTWQERRRKRKEILSMNELVDITSASVTTEAGTSGASSMTTTTFTVTRDDASSTTLVVEEDSGDSTGSLCLEGSSSSVSGFL